MNAIHDGEYGELVDPFLENQYEPYEMARMVACAAAAVRHSGRRRPKMSQVMINKHERHTYFTIKFFFF